MDTGEVENGKLITSRRVWAYCVEWVATQLHDETERAERVGIEVLTVPSLRGGVVRGMTHSCRIKNVLQCDVRGVGSVKPISTHHKGYLAHSNPYTEGFRNPGKTRTPGDGRQAHPSTTIRQGSPPSRGATLLTSPVVKTQEVSRHAGGVKTYGDSFTRTLSSSCISRDFWFAVGFIIGQWILRV